MKYSPLLETQRRVTENRLELMPALDGAWELPAVYGLSEGAVWDEYQAIVLPDRAGVIDRSWRAVLQVRGRDRASFLQGMLTNDILALEPGQGCHAAHLDSTGHLIAEVFVHARPDALLIETDPRVVERLAQQLEKFLIMEKAAISDVSDNWTVLAVQGAGAQALLNSVLQAEISAELPPLAHAVVDLEGGKAAMAVAHSQQDGPGFELWLPAESAPALWEKLTAAGAAPVGELAAEILRVEAGIPAWGRELSESILLPEAGFGDIISYTKGCYVGQEIIARLRARGHTNRALRSILLEEGAPNPRPGDPVQVPASGAEPGREIGRITSSVLSPRFGNRPLALAYLRKEYFENGTLVEVRPMRMEGLDRLLPGIVLTRPFSLTPTM